MAVGKSGKVVVELEPQFKRELRAALELDGLTLKAWFIQAAERYLASRGQTELMFSDNSPPIPTSESL